MHDRVLAAIVETSLYGYAVMDEAFTFIYVSPSFADLVGRPADSLVGSCALDLVHPDDRDQTALNIAEYLGPEERSGDVGVPVVLRFVRSDGTVVTLEAGLVDQRHHPDIGGFVVRLRPMRGQEHLSAGLRLLAQGFAPREVLGELVLAVEGIIEGGRGLIAARDPGRRWHLPRSVDPLLTMSHPLPGGEMPKLWDKAQATGACEVAYLADLEAPIAAAAEAAGYQACWLIPIHDPHVEAAIVVWRVKQCRPYNSALLQLNRVADVVGLTLERHRSYRQLEHAARHDALTRLVNRATFHDQLEAALVASTKDEGDQVGLLFVDLDGFKQINDHHGHQAGDVVLVEMANRLREAVRDADVVSRLGGDEFAVICQPLTTPAELESVAARVVAAVARPVVLQDADAGATPMGHIPAGHPASGSTVQIGASVGGVLADPRWTAAQLDEGHDACERLLVEADRAMYRAKRAGGARLSLHHVRLG